MKQHLLSTLLLLASVNLYAQVGIGTTTPKAFFNVASGKDVLFGQDVSGSGSKLLWNPNKAAFRAGYVIADGWDPAQMGLYSFATGYNTRANGNNATAIGYVNTASGTRAIALGVQAEASGANSMALGFNAIASGFNSTAMGSNISTNTNGGAFIIGDFGDYEYSNSAGNQMMMRFGGGYILYTDNGPQTSSVGVRLASNGNAWQTLSDSTRKENYRPANGASFLQKISRMRLGSWNYKGQDAKQYRHYGPMAQDFFAAFGHDALGTIGEDKSINQADFDGVNLIAIQALIQKVEKLETDNQQLRQQLNGVDQLKAELETARQQGKTIQAQLDQIEARLNNSPNPTSIILNP